MARSELTESGGRLPQPTEEVHLPDPSFLPVLTALGVTIILVGVVLHWILAGIGVVVTLIAITRWIRAVRVEMSELPLEH